MHVSDPPDKKSYVLPYLNQFDREKNKKGTKKESETLLIISNNAYVNYLICVFMNMN